MKVISNWSLAEKMVYDIILYESTRYGYYCINHEVSTISTITHLVAKGLVKEIKNFRCYPEFRYFVTYIKISPNQ